jgi:hypothetical protein
MSCSRSCAAHLKNLPLCRSSSQPCLAPAPDFFTAGARCLGYLPNNRVPWYRAGPAWNPAMTSVDLTHCDREPIHLLGTLQPFGFLIAVSTPDWFVQRVSANITDWLNIAPADMLGRSLLGFFSDSAGKPLDLSQSVLRSVSYLRNLGVRASMSVSILRQGRLWGSFALSMCDAWTSCRPPTPKLSRRIPARTVSPDPFPPSR